MESRGADRVAGGVGSQQKIQGETAPTEPLFTGQSNSSRLDETSAPDAAAADERPLKVVWVLAWPVVILNALQVLNTLVDRYFIGHLDRASLVGHGGATSVMFLSFSLAVAVAAGPTAIVSRAFGAGNPREVRRAAGESLAVAAYAGVAAAILLALLAFPAARAILPRDAALAARRMGEFTAIYALGLPATFLIQSLAASLRGIGDTRSPTVISGGQIGLHMALNVLLVPRMGLNGAAVALTTSGWIAAIGYILWAGRTELAIRTSVRPPRREWAARILRVASPAAVMSTLRVLSLTVFTVVLGLVAGGSDAIAAMTTGFAIESVLFAPAFGLAAAAGTLVGQSLGMGRPDRAERLAWICAGFATISVLVFVAPVAIFTPAIARGLVGDKPEVIREAVSLIRMLCLTEVLFCVGMVLFGAMQGAGDTRRPLWISLVALWGVRVPAAAGLALGAGTALGAGLRMPFGAGLGPTGAWIAMSSTQALQGVLAILVFRRGGWKSERV